MTKGHNQCPRCKGYQTKLLSIRKGKAVYACQTCKNVWNHKIEDKK